ncbi:histidine kinase [Streptomyces sp. NBC_00237]|uniref:sensor histidine kinase n=1 Tax=Streptomyces sp. NBC_00237 TaxID=2975687 RepID=UPI002258CBDC|nr:ATP-binding protein [Streptomyces sp. NBC_00237]MCX5201227.1 histidine kinase [Streptomyces sp. NBC_00237]
MHDKPTASAAHRAWAAGRHWLEGRTVDRRALDLLIPLICFALMLLDVPGLAEADNALNGISAAAVLAVGASSLLLRRRAPWIPYVIALGFLGWLHELTLIQFALYSVGRYRGRAAAIVATLGYGLFAYVMFLMPGWPEQQADTLMEFLSLVVPIGVLAAGVGVAGYRQDLVRELEVQRGRTAALQAVQQERLSVARDVHDFVGRELTLLAVRAEVLAVRARGEAHQKDFDELSDTARKAHRILNEIIVQRAREKDATPGIDGLAVLASEGEQAGSRVVLDIDGRAGALSPLRQAAVYRVVQECLTNAVKHAPGQEVRVRITLDGVHLRIEVCNDLPNTAPAKQPVSAGTGTFSMGERVESMGGTLEAGLHDGKYRVLAVLPAGV